MRALLGCSNRCLPVNQPPYSKHLAQCATFPVHVADYMEPFCGPKGGGLGRLHRRGG